MILIIIDHRVPLNAITLSVEVILIILTSNWLILDSIIDFIFKKFFYQYTNSK